MLGHMSKFTLFVMLKVVICIDSDCFNNVFRLGGFEHRQGPNDVDFCRGSSGKMWIRRERYVGWCCHRVGAEMKQWFDNHGGVKVETPACARTGDKASEKSQQWHGVPVFATSYTSEGVVTINVMIMMATDARDPAWVDREVQLVADADEEC